MTNDIYSAPAAALEQPVETASEKFYVVAPLKFWVLFLSTVGLYQVYWFYRHWHQFRMVTQEKIWPVPRGLFAIFFVHRLFREMDAAVKQKTGGVAWSPDLVATGYLLGAVVSNVCDRLSGKDVGSPYTDVVSLVLLPLVGWFLYQAQQVANLAMGDPAGASNRQFSAANIVWIVLGCLFWALVALGLLVIFMPDQFGLE